VVEAKRSVPTVSDVAARAGVSNSTVSKALSGRGQMKPETRRRVAAAAEELGWQPNVLARGLLTGRSYTVGLITTDSFGRFTIPVMLGAEDTLGAGQMSVLLCDGRGDPIREQHYLRTLLARRVDGVMVTGRRLEPRPPIATDLPVPIVYAFAQSTRSEDTSVINDDAQGAELALRHLLTTGRTKVAHITGPARHISARLRADAATKVLAEANLQLIGGEPLWGEWTEAWGREAVALLLRSEQPFDAIFCGSDQLARGVLEALREAGRKVPTDVGVIGFDNWEVMSLATRPLLTTVDLDLGQLGHYAATKLLDAIDGRPDPGVHTLPCRLVIRQSTALSDL
jgi:LacI family transcriptional regulator